jgi:hypothetical protein
MGRHLFSLFKKSDLSHLDVSAVTDFLLDFQKARQIFRLDYLISKAGVDKAKGETWLKSLEQADKDGCFFSSVTVYIVKGRKVCTD